LSVLLPLLLACADAAPPDPDPRVELEGVVAELPGGTRLAAARAGGIPGAGGTAEDVKAHLPADASAPPLEVTAARSTWDLRAGRLQLEGEVVATRADATLTCARADVFFDGAGKVARIEARGDVLLVQGERSGRAQRADLEAAAGRVTLRDGASLSEPPHRMVGEPIVVFLDDERIECDACRLRIDGAGIGQAP
jgi:lipopolysaccharide export system protein LptA